MQERVTQFLAAPVSFTRVAVFLEKGYRPYWSDLSKVEEIGFHLNVADR